MVVRRSRLAPLVGVVVALFLTAGVVAAAGGVFNASTALLAGNKTFSSPCSSVSATLTPGYDTDGFYKVENVAVSLTCGAGDYSVRVTLATGASSYVERSATTSFVTAGTQSLTIAFPAGVKLSDVTNIAALVLPVGS